MTTTSETPVNRAVRDRRRWAVLAICCVAAALLGIDTSVLNYAIPSLVINLPVMAVVVVAGALLLPESRNPKPGRLDWISVPLSVTGMLGAVYAIKTATRDCVHEPSGSPLRWESPL